MRLINRTTRSLSLTDAGRSYFERAQRVLADLEEANRAVSEHRESPRGRLKVSAPLSFGFLHLAPALSDFVDSYPDVNVEVALNDRYVDLVNEGFDVAVRIGSLEDSRLIARKLAPARIAVCASPKYIAAHGAPETPADLKSHECFCNFNSGLGREWRFQRVDGTPWPVAVSGRIGLDNGDAVRVCTLNGLRDCDAAVVHRRRRPQKRRARLAARAVHAAARQPQRRLPPCAPPFLGGARLRRFSRPPLQPPALLGLGGGSSLL